MKKEIDTHKIKIQPYYRFRQWGGYKIVPSLFLCGNWLEQAGFHPGDRVKISVKDGLLFIQKDHPTEDNH